MPFYQPYEVVEAIQTMLVTGDPAVPADIRDQLLMAIKPGRPPVESAIDFGEIAYARRSDLASAVLAMAADVVDLATQGNWAGWRDNGRGPSIAAVLRAMPGVVPPNPPSPPTPPHPDPRFDPNGPGGGH